MHANNKKWPAPVTMRPQKAKPTVGNCSQLAYTMREVAGQIGVCEKTIYALVKAGQLKSFRIGRSVRISRESIDAFIGRGGAT